jgi:hypothetical protein
MARPQATISLNSRTVATLILCSILAIWLSALPRTLTSLAPDSFTSIAGQDEAKSTTLGKQSVTETIRSLALVTKDLVYSSNTHTIYASLPSDAGATGNSILPIEPLGASIGSSTFIGSEPGRLAMADDGHTLYAALDGAAAVRRFDVVTQTAGQQFSLGNVPFDGPRYVNDLDVQPGNPNVVAVGRKSSDPTSTSGDVAVYENGVQRPNTTAARTRSFIEFGSTPDTLYAYSGFNSLLKLKVDASGLTLLTTTNLSPGTVDMKFDNGRLYTTDGRAIDPESHSVVGMFTWQGSIGNSLVRPDSAVGRVYFLTSDFAGNVWTLRVFGQDNFSQIGTLDVPGVQGTPGSLIRWGSNGLAFRTDSQVFLLQTSLIPSNDPTPSPTPTPAPSPVPSPSPSPTLFVRQVNLLTKDLVVIPGTQAIYASVPSDAGQIGNSLTRINPVDGIVGPSTVGSDPSKFALADDGHTIYASLKGASAVRR